MREVEANGLLAIHGKQGGILWIIPIFKLSKQFERCSCFGLAQA